MIQDIAPHRYDNTYHIQKPGAQDYVFCIQKGRILLRETAEEHVLTIPRREEIEAAVPELMDRAVYLFSVDEKPYFLVSVPEKEAEEILAKLKEGAEKELEQLYYAWKTPTDIRAMEPMHQAFAAITAVQLWRWRQSRQFCGRCGAKTEDSKIERALVCPVCGQTEYPKISPAVIVAITNGDKLLMSRYRVNHSTYRGYALIAGFVEIGETFEETVRREVMEEVGLKVKNIRYFKSQPWAFTDTEMIGFFAELDGDDKIRLQEDELSEAGWYTREEIPDDARLISVGTEMKMYFKDGPDWEKKWQEHQK
ncbi:NAD(+) diphosphatase [Clostridium sp.]|uniref:NAD(+) diphosphatase n=1 Tax=Clostridium sp. TaxID=1506 RepID=UPI002587EB7C|nr:NAD(+) diphosphatase [Clostridium sp.]